MEWIIWLTVSIQLWEGLCMLFVRPFPDPFSSTQYFLEHGGIVPWGLVHISVVAFVVASHLMKSTLLVKISLCFQNALLMTTMVAMWGDSSWAMFPRLAMGSAYIVPAYFIHAIVSVAIITSMPKDSFDDFFRRVHS